MKSGVFLTIRSGFICWIGCCDTWNIHTAVTPSNIKYQKKQMWHFFLALAIIRQPNLEPKHNENLLWKLDPPYQQTHIFLNDGTCLGWNLQTVQLRQPCFTDISGICYDIHRLNGLYALLRSNSKELRFQLSPLPGLSWACLR